MRRPRINYDQINTEIIITNISETLCRIVYYSINGNLTHQLCNPKDAEKVIEDIKKERNNLCVWIYGKGLTYPLKEKKSITKK